MRFNFATATRIIFGEGVLDEVPQIAAAWGKRAVVVTGRSTARATPTMKKLTAAGVECLMLRVSEEPSVSMVQEFFDEVSEADCDMVIGFGGGSALDVAKALSMMTANDGELSDYVEGKEILASGIPVLAIPTTAGTGAEVSPSVMLLSSEHSSKVALRSEHMLPRVALVDPTITYSMPPSLTAFTGFLALSHVLETYVSSDSNPLTDAICREGLFRSAYALPRAVAHSHDVNARQELALTSLFGGLATSSAHPGAVVALANTMGGIFPIPYGILCARLLPFVMEANIQALTKRDPENPAVARYDEIAQLLTGEVEATAIDGALWVRECCEEYGLPSLSEYGISEDSFEEILEQVESDDRLQGNPLHLQPKELRWILQQAL